jgi:hypothetical protein
VEKIAFMDEIKALRQRVSGEWLISGNFNLIYRMENKSNSRVNRRLIGKFKSLLDELELRELPLQGHKFTWTGGQHAGPKQPFDKNR